MKAQIKIEAIGDDTDQLLRAYANFTNSLVPGLGDMTFGTNNGKPKPSYWVAQITGVHQVFHYERKFLKGKKDYTYSNSKGSRGVYVYYLLESGNIYEVKSPVSWKRTERYFCIVTEDGEIQRVNKEYVDKWIDDHLAYLPC